ncbi:hypothetical protein, partial [Escherichia coli]|uniref:hypothetical protein n=1 Tax=Escherichia coli TaxID=562 RepID=UPI001BDBB106
SHRALSEHKTLSISWSHYLEYPAFFASIFIESSTSRFSSIHLANSLISELFFIVAFIFIDACEG